MFGVETSAGTIGVSLFITGYILMMAGMLKNKRMLFIVREMVKVTLGDKTK